MVDHAVFRKAAQTLLGNDPFGFLAMRQHPLAFAAHDQALRASGERECGIEWMSEVARKFQGFIQALYGAVGITRDPVEKTAGPVKRKAQWVVVGVFDDPAMQCGVVGRFYMVGIACRLFVVGLPEILTSPGHVPDRQ